MHSFLLVIYMRIIVTEPKGTVIKTLPIQSTNLKPEQQWQVKYNALFRVKGFTEVDQNDHFRVELIESTIKQSPLYFYKKHVKLDPSDGLPVYANLDIPYFSQRDNTRDPYRTCNVTSVAMCLSYLGHLPKRAGEQLEDELDRYVAAKGWSRYTHDHLARLVQHYGYKDKFVVNASWNQLKYHLASGYPVITAGMFTKSGHILVLRGFNETEKCFYVNDPFGEWFASGYQNKSGENLKYSYNMIQRLSMAGTGAAWAHFIYN